MYVYIYILHIYIYIYYTHIYIYIRMYYIHGIRYMVCIGISLRYFANIMGTYWKYMGTQWNRMGYRDMI